MNRSLAKQMMGLELKYKTDLQATLVGPTVTRPVLESRYSNI